MDGSVKRPRSSPRGEDDVIVLDDCEHEEGTSIVEPRDNSLRGPDVDKGCARTSQREKVLEPKKVLKLFRVDEKKLA